MREISKTIHTSEIPIESRTDLISHGSEDENKRIQITRYGTAYIVHKQGTIQCKKIRKNIKN